MKTVSLKINSSVFDETEEILSDVKISRNRYINDAIDFYNKIQKRKLLSKQLLEESKLVASDSMEVLKDFEIIENES